MTIPVYIGYDSRERIAYHVLQHSILEMTSEPCLFVPIGNSLLPKHVWSRGKGPMDSTEFSTARFMVPFLQGYTGWAIFMDCDMVAGRDIARLWAQRNDAYAVMVVQHEHAPPEAEKFLGARQTQYPRKNWSSLMLINCGHPACRDLSPRYVNAASGLELHRFHWCPDEAIGALRGSWNVLSTPEGLQHPEGQPEPVDLLHYTHGGPWHGVFTHGSHLWLAALKRMLAEKNPKASATANQGHSAVVVTAAYAHDKVG